MKSDQERRQEAFPTSAEVMARNIDFAGSMIRTQDTCVCAHCQAYTSHVFGYVQSVVYPHGQAVGYRPVGGEETVFFGLCLACNKETIFVGHTPIYPVSIAAPAAHSDLPADIADDFNEARLIYHASPRGAAALLRLAVQKLCGVLGSDERDINRAIGQLVREGLIPASVQKALDSVRVVGNEAVHPGLLDLKDDHATVGSLFKLVNFIAEKAIGEPKRIDEIFAGLPPGKLEGIAQRDGLDGT